MKGAEVWSIFKESNEKSVRLLFCVCCLLSQISACQLFELCGTWQPARSLIWSTARWPSSLLSSSFQTCTVSCSRLVSAFAWGVCVPRILQFPKNSLCARQDRSLQARPLLQSFPSVLLEHLVLVQEYPAWLEDNGRGRVQIFPAFFYRELSWQMILVVLKHKTPYGEQYSSCSTVNFGTWTDPLYVV